MALYVHTSHPHQVHLKFRWLCSGGETQSLCAGPKELGGKAIIWGHGSRAIHDPGHPRSGSFDSPMLSYFIDTGRSCCSNKKTNTITPGWGYPWSQFSFAEGFCLLVRGGGTSGLQLAHDDIMTWKCLLHYWPFVRGIHQSLVDSLHKRPVIQTSKSLLLLMRTSCSTNSRVASDSCDVTAMLKTGRPPWSLYVTKLGLIIICNTTLPHYNGVNFLKKHS